MDDSLQKQVDDLIKKAVESLTAESALKYSQAALNVAHTKHALFDMKD